jgi:phospholipase/carboxylesterase
MISMLEFIEVETAPNPDVAVIWLHGLGADGNDFVPIVQELPLEGCPPVRFIFPHANVIPVTVNNGYKMRAWYDIMGADLVRREDEAGLRASEAAVAELIDAQVARGIAPERIVLAGFSQGCAMTLQTGLRYPQRLAGLMCLSGYLPLAGMLAAERSEANRDVPVFMAHGSSDGVVPIARAIASRDALQALGYAVDWHAYPMPHSVCPQEIGDIAAWMQRVLA